MFRVISAGHLVLRFFMFISRGFYLGTISPASAFFTGTANRGYHLKNVTVIRFSHCEGTNRINIESAVSVPQGPLHCSVRGERENMTRVFELISNESYENDAKAALPDTP